MISIFHNKEAGNIPASSSISGKQRRKTGFVIRLLFLTGACIAGVWGVLQSPWYKDRLYSHSSLAHLQKLRSKKGDDPQLLYFIGLKLNHEGRFAEADPILRNAVGQEPYSARLRDQWAQALLGSGLTTAAFGELKEFVGRRPDSAEANLLMGKFYITQHSNEKGMEYLNTAVHLQPDLAEAWSYLASAQQDMDELDAARNSAQHAVNLKPDNADYRLSLATLQESAGTADQARDNFEAAIRLNSKLAPAYTFYAHFLLQTGRQEDAITAVSIAKKAIELNPNDAASQLAEGQGLERDGELSEAISPLQKTAELAKNDPIPAAALVRIYSRLGQHEQVKLWQRELQKRQFYVSKSNSLLTELSMKANDALLNSQLAALEGEHGVVDGCVRHYMAALHGRPDSAQVMTAASRALLKGGYVWKALPLAKRAVYVGSANPDSHRALGDILLALNQPALAIKQYNIAIEYAPEQKRALLKKMQDYYLARADKAQKDYLMAVRLEHEQVGTRPITSQVESLAKDALQLEPGNPLYLQYQVHIHVAKHQFNRAIAACNRLLAASPDDPFAHATLAAILAETAHTPSDFAKVENHIHIASRYPAFASTCSYALGLLDLQKGDAKNAASELLKSVHLDPNVDITYYKLALAQQRAGQTSASAKNMKIYLSRQARKRKETDLLGDIAQHPDQSSLYERAASYYNSIGLHAQASAILTAEKRYAMNPNKGKMK